jgi:hypothetical protein
MIGQFLMIKEDLQSHGKEVVYNNNEKKEHYIKSNNNKLN